MNPQNHVIQHILTQNVSLLTSINFFDEMFVIQQALCENEAAQKNLIKEQEILKTGLEIKSIQIKDLRAFAQEQEKNCEQKTEQINLEKYKNLRIINSLKQNLNDEKDKNKALEEHNLELDQIAKIIVDLSLSIRLSEDHRNLYDSCPEEVRNYLNNLSIQYLSLKSSQYIINFIIISLDKYHKDHLKSYNINKLENLINNLKERSESKHKMASFLKRKIDRMESSFGFVNMHILEWLKVLVDLAIQLEN